MLDYTSYSQISNHEIQEFDSNQTIYSHGHIKYVEPGIVQKTSALCTASKRLAS